MITFMNDLLVKLINTYRLILNAFRIRKRCLSDRRLDGKVVLITGANTGIGKETALQLSLRGAKIIIGCRDLAKADGAIDEIRAKSPNANITAVKLDLSSLTSVRQFCQSIGEQVSTIDVLINNAGIALCPESTTEDGFELQFATNHLGHFLLTLSLLSLLKNSSKARVINVSSMGHIVGHIHFENINLRNNAYQPLKAYNQSKLANVLFTRELARRLGPETNINVYSLHPGVIRTELSRHSSQSIMSFLCISVELGVQTTLYCALEESLDNETGFYYDDCRRVDRMTSQATDDQSAQKLWELSCDLVKLEDRLRIGLNSNEISTQDKNEQQF